VSISDRDLGMHRDITRRDFLNGVTVGLTGSMVAPAWLQAAGEQAALAPEQAPGYYPPSLTGMRGSHAGSFEVAHQMRDNRGWKSLATDTGEAYDLVIVGGGISGLAAARFFREAVGPRASILVLDNHDDFGGHAKRNEFQLDGRMFMLNGGTLNIEAPKQYSDVSMGLLRRLGIDIERFERETEEDRGLYRRMGLRNGVFFPKESPASFKLVPLIKYITYVPGGLYNVAFAMIANPAKWGQISEADRKVSQSEVEPMMMPTSGFIAALYHRRPRAQSAAASSSRRRRNNCRAAAGGREPWLSARAWRCPS